MVNPKKSLVDCKMSRMDSPELDSKAILMLSLISSSAKKGWLGITKLQKLSFLTEYFLMEKRKRAFGYEFFMYDQGPISKGVYDDYETMLDEELIVEDENGIQISEFGNDIHEQFAKAIPEEIRAVMNFVVDRYAHMKTHELVKTVHQMRVRLSDGSATRIDDIARSHIVLPKSLHTDFKIGTDYLETLAILANRPLIEAIRAARKKGSTISLYKPLTSS